MWRWIFIRRELVAGVAEEVHFMWVPLEDEEVRTGGESVFPEGKVLRDIQWLD